MVDDIVLYDEQQMVTKCSIVCVCLTFSLLYVLMHYISCFFQIDLLHPFASLEWSECKELPVGMTDAQAVWLEDKIYMGGGDTSGRRNDARLYIYAPTTDTWTVMDTAVYWFALTIYHSQLVLVGGREYVGLGALGLDTNKLWTLDERDELQETLPPMRVRRYGVSAASHGDHLLVAGGGGDGSQLDIVEVYSDHIWSSAQPLPQPFADMKSTVLSGHWYLMGGFRQGTEVYCASLDSLVAGCQPSETSQTSSVWKRLPDVHNTRFTPSSFGNRLTAIGGQQRLPMSSIQAFSPRLWSWVDVGNLPVVGCRVCTVVLPSGELIVMGGFLNNTRFNKVYKATLKG